MHKLSLSKKKTEEIPQLKSEETQSTQEVFSKAAFEDEDVDFSLDVTDIKGTKKREEEKTGDDFAGIISTAVKELRSKMEIRFAIAKAREGLAYGLQEGNNVPPFCRIQLSCRPDVLDKNIYLELQKTWDQKEETIRKTLLTESVEFFDSKLQVINDELKSTLDAAKEVIGLASKSAGDARKELVRRFIDMKDKQQKRLLEFKTDIRSRIPSDLKLQKTGKNKRDRRNKPY
ncbi:Hypothetical predicted protein [Mytilus galloprovincialis]|nr:Hypothetical predicted protein [Mytilus galloprovincialis]